MGVPSGEIIARPMVARACGCVQEFQHYAVDRYREQRKAKFQKTRCPACVAKLVEEQRRAATLPKKGEAFKALPPGTEITMSRRPDSTWAGTLVGDGTKVEATGEGPQGVTLALARAWLMARGLWDEAAAAAADSKPPIQPIPTVLPHAVVPTPPKSAAKPAAPKPAPAPKPAAKPS
ncbi:unnamed protein product [Gemmataceae bacterium]|nr:unnamed protein product [Gemmataceae bacterium]VTT96678.1 unnamed protein product [Gemmataceae bacterium]